MIYKLFDEKTGSEMTATSNVNINKMLAHKLHKDVIRKFRRRTIYSKFKNIFGQYFK